MCWPLNLLIFQAKLLFHHTILNANMYTQLKCVYANSYLCTNQRGNLMICFRWNFFWLFSLGAMNIKKKRYKIRSSALLHKRVRKKYMHWFCIAEWIFQDGTFFNISRSINKMINKKTNWELSILTLLHLICVKYFTTLMKIKNGDTEKEKKKRLSSFHTIRMI